VLRSENAQRILFVGHGGLPNGFSRVLDSILKNLPECYELHHLVINGSHGDSIQGWTSHGNPYLPEIHSRQALHEVITAIQPNLLFVLDEPWVCARRLNAVRQCFPGLRTVVYCAVDGEESVTPEIAADLARADAIVVFTRFARDILDYRFGGHLNKLHIIPHGVDLRAFYPLCCDGPQAFKESRRIARKLLFPQAPELESAFVVLNANRNQPWKNIEACIEGFALFARNKPANVKLYLHMGTHPAPPGTRSLVDHFGIRDRLLYTDNTDRHPHVPTEKLNLIYNACDVGMNTSDKEGWGLISFEHGATGAAQIVPRHSAPAELWNGSAWLLDTETEPRIRGYRRAGRPVKPESAAEALELLYGNHNVWSQSALAAYRNATQPQYEWRVIAKQWQHLFDDLLVLPPDELQSAK
jgi:D-inositol-3-phosphate glycosyltransferase